MENKKSTAETLLRKLYITSSIRHSAAGRLALHSWASQWTLALLAVGQIVIGLIVILGLKARFSDSYVSFAAIFFGVLVLAYSLLLGMSNFSVRKERFHDCALKLGKLALFVTDFINNGEKEEEKIENFIHKYNRVLSISENHTQSDYIKYKIKNSEASCSERFMSFLGTIFQFGHYFVSIFMMYIWIFMMVLPK